MQLSKLKDLNSDWASDEQFRHTVKPVLIVLATIIIVASSLKDISQVGFRLNWLLIRLAYLPYILVIYWLYRRFIHQKWVEMPLWASGLYITLFVSYFAAKTG